MAREIVNSLRGRPFAKGASGNVAGRPLGARNKTTLAAAALLDGEAEHLTRKAIELALINGDMAALRLCLERILPARRERLVQFELPPLEAAADAPKAMAAITKAASLGKLTMSEAVDMAKLVETFLKAFQIEEFEQRLERLEAEAKRERGR